MNGRCETCDLEEACGYEYKPCECCNYRKFKPHKDIADEVDTRPQLQVIQGGKHE